MTSGPSSTQATTPAYAGMSVITPVSARSAVTPPVSTGSPSLAATSIKRGGSSDGFDDYWTMSLGSAGARKPAGGCVKSLKDLEKEKGPSGNFRYAQSKAVAVAASGTRFGSFVRQAVPSSSGSGAPAGADEQQLVDMTISLTWTEAIVDMFSQF